jgi:acetyltransferase-like isoleucine patch superfamily enzyme
MNVDTAVVADERRTVAGAAPVTGAREGRRSRFLSRAVLALYRRLRHDRFRKPLRKFILRMEGGEFYSLTIRDIFREFHGVDIGLYTYGPLAANPGHLRRITKVGRYSSVFPTARRFNMNHPTNIKSTHPFFYDAQDHVVDSDIISYSTLTIGNDVWIGHNVIILPTVATIGDGAVIGAGAVVASDVPPYAVVAGYPARVVRYRFSQQTIQRLLEEQWWLKSLEELRPNLADFRKPLEDEEKVR